MPKTPKLPKITSAFALLDVMVGRNKLEKVVGAGYRIPVVIHGYIQNGRGGVGGDDGTSREFSIDVDNVALGEPEFAPADVIGRPWALVADLKAGDKITLDGSFTCLTASEQRKAREVLADKTTGELYFRCAEGRHGLSGQIGDHDEYVGVYKVS